MGIPNLRTMREFAEQELVLPDGPHRGKLFRVDRHPVLGLWLDALDSGKWNRHVLTAPTQSGKTLAGFVIPLMYHLFELNETVICGLPDMNLAADKWREDIKPAIDKSRFKELLPKTGEGSRGGKFTSIKFRNGATLRFMSGGGNDKKRAGFTSRVLIVTETDGLDESGSGSREADKLKQLEARTRAYGANKRIYMECTVSTKQGRTWQEYLKGTESQVTVPCPHCNRWVVPEREDLIGWQDAESVMEAQDKTAFSCPECGIFLSDEDRIEMNCQAKVIHRGQKIEQNGEIGGPTPQTDTLGFRWSAFNNLLLNPSDFAADEWKASREADEDNAEKEMRQFVWALPYIPPVEQEHELEFEALIHRQNNWTRHTVPTGITLLTAGVDVGKWMLHWKVIAWGREHTSSGDIIDYGRIEVPSNEMPEEKAVLIALRQYREIAVTGFPSKEGLVPVTESWIDTNYETDTVYQFVRESGPGFVAHRGLGKGQFRNYRYHAPTKKTDDIREIGKGYHLVRQREKRVDLMEVDTNHWKSDFHSRLSCPIDSPGSLKLFRDEPRNHLGVAKHLTAEVQERTFVPGKGEYVVWVAKRKHNHWLDCGYMATAAGYRRGARVIESEDESEGTGSWFEKQTGAK